MGLIEALYQDRQDYGDKCYRKGMERQIKVDAEEIRELRRVIQELKKVIND